jgi:hypothetical protein
MSISRSLDLHGRTKRDNSLFRSRTDFIDFCDGLLNEHDRFISRHKRQRKRNFKVLKKNFEDLLDQHCKLLLVRVDVSYLYDANKDIHQFDADLNTFRRLIHLRQDCFEHVLDYSWVIEQDRDEGYLCQFLFIYDGSYRNHTEKYVEEIIQILDDIEEENDSLNRESKHQHRDSYEQDTLKSDMIHCNDVQIEENNLNIISILANFDIEDQYLRARVKGMRCFG